MAKAIFGGSFDPPHIGHLEVIQQAITSLNIDELIVMPAFLNPFKSSSFAPADLRLKWLKSMTKEIPKVSVSSFEVDKNRAVASIETVKHFKNSEELFLIIGADNLSSLSQWKDYETLNEMVTWVVATRDEIPVPSKYKTLEVHKDISATQLRKQVQEAYIDKKIANEVIHFYQEQGSPTMQERIENISNVLDKNKADNIEVFDLRGKDYFVDQVVIATSLNSKHTEALLNYMKNELKPAETFLGTDVSDEWVVADLGDILIHIMTAEYRTKYNMEEFLGELGSNREE